MNTKYYTIMLLLAALPLACLLMGCPPVPQAKVSVLLSADLGAGDKAHGNDAGGTPWEDILSLQATVTEITLGRVSGASQDTEEGEGDDSIPSKVVVFSGALDVEFRDLVGISELIAVEEIPAGAYNKIRLSIENPRLILADNPDEVITDVQLTANGRLFVNTHFTIPAGQRSLILLDFQGLHLVETGQGKFVWTPQLRATISVVPADIIMEGVIESVDDVAETLVLLPTSAVDSIEVQFDGAVIFLPEDTDTPTGTAADLVPGAQIVIEGVLNLAGEVTAEVIWILN